MATHHLECNLECEVPYQPFHTVLCRSPVPVPVAIHRSRCRAGMASSTTLCSRQRHELLPAKAQAFTKARARRCNVAWDSHHARCMPKERIINRHAFASTSCAAAQCCEGNLAGAPQSPPPPPGHVPQPRACRTSGSDDVHDPHRSLPQRMEHQLWAIRCASQRARRTKDGRQVHLCTSRGLPRASRTTPCKQHHARLATLQAAAPGAAVWSLGMSVPVPYTSSGGV